MFTECCLSCLFFPWSFVEEFTKKLFKVVVKVLFPSQNIICYARFTLFALFFPTFQVVLKNCPPSIIECQPLENNQLLPRLEAINCSFSPPFHRDCRVANTVCAGTGTEDNRRLRCHTHRIDEIDNSCRFARRRRCSCWSRESCCTKRTTASVYFAVNCSLFTVI